MHHCLVLEDCTYCWKTVHIVGRLYILLEDCTYCWKTVRIVGRLYVLLENYVLLEDCTYCWKTTYFWKTVRIVFYDKGNKVGVACVGEKRSVHRVLVRKCEGKRPHSRPGCRWEVSIKMGCKTVRWEVVDRIDVAQSRNKW